MRMLVAIFAFAAAAGCGRTRTHEEMTKCVQAALDKCTEQGQREDNLQACMRAEFDRCP
jgi:hypothetical protein